MKGFGGWGDFEGKYERGRRSTWWQEGGERDSSRGAREMGGGGGSKHDQVSDYCHWYCGQPPIEDLPPLHYIGKQTIRTSCPKLKATRGTTIIAPTKGRQLMVATSENPGAGFGDLSLCLWLAVPAAAHLSPIYCRLARGRRCVPNVSESQVSPMQVGGVRHLGQPPFPHCPFVRKRPKLSACPSLDWEVNRAAVQGARPSILLWGEFWSIIAPPAFCDQPTTLSSTLQCSL